MPWFGGVLAVLLLTGCAGVDVQHRPVAYGASPYDYEPGRRIGPQARPPDTVYTGWRVFQDRCASCHGPAARGTQRGPDLLPGIATMDSRRFTKHVMSRYQWGLAEQQGGHDQMDALIEEIERRRRGELQMPAFQNEPRVTAHIADLYSYLSARADGSQGPGRPVRY